MIPFWKKTDKRSKKKPQKPAMPRTAQQSIPMQRMFEDGTYEVDRAAGPLAPRNIHWKLTWERFLKLRRGPLQGL